MVVQHGIIFLVSFEYQFPKKENIDKYVTVIEVDLEDVFELYRGHGSAVELNN